MTYITYIFFIIGGTIVGSFAGVVAERLFTGQSWITGRSRCNSCGRILSTPDLLPVLSYLMSGGRCRRCGSRVPIRYPIIEATTGFLFLAAYIKIGFSLSLVLFLVAVSILLVIVLYDARHTFVPKGALELFLGVIFVYAISTMPTPLSFGTSLVTAGLIALLFFLLHVCSGGRAMGLGDAPVALGLSILVAPYALSGLFFSFWIGAAVGIIILVRAPKGHRMGIEVPFVPFLAVGFILAFFIEWNPLAPF